MLWNVLVSTEYEVWFLTLPEKDQVAVDLEVLRSQGPQLGRPYVDQVFNRSRVLNPVDLMFFISFPARQDQHRY